MAVIFRFFTFFPPHATGGLLIRRGIVRRENAANTDKYRELLDEENRREAESLAAFTEADLIAAWGEPPAQTLWDDSAHPEAYLHVDHWKTGEFNVDVSFDPNGKVHQALTLRSADQPTLW